MKKLLIVTLALIGLSVWAAAPPALPDAEKDPQAFAKVMKDNLSGVSGHVSLMNGKAELDLNNGYSFLDATKGRFLLETLWQNPEDADILGVILPPKFDPFADTGAWATIVYYDNSGHVSDSDAKDMNYNELLKQMKEGAAENNKLRVEKGFPKVEVIGWATTPHYDQANKKLYWAKEIAFAGTETHTLNYMIRILGREGTLDLNVVAAMADLQAVETATPDMLKQVNFAKGQSYADFNSSTDHLAEFGVAGLILGGIAVKAGLLKVILGVLAASWKFIAIGVAAIGGFIFKLLKGRKNQ